MEWDYYTNLRVECLRLANSAGEAAGAMVKRAAAYYEFATTPHEAELGDPVCPACGAECQCCIPQEDQQASEAPANIGSTQYCVGDQVGNLLTFTSAPKKPTLEVYLNGSKIGEL